MAAGARPAIAAALRTAARRMGFDVQRVDTRNDGFPLDASAEDRRILAQIAPFTMTSQARQLSLIQATRHIVRSGLQGCVVECGVWRGGSAMAVALTLMQECAGTRDLVLFDTFDGMTQPAEIDRRGDGTPAAALLQADAARQSEVWAVADLDDVQHNLRTTGYPAQHLHYVKGDVQATLPSQAPTGPIALLRLDTDWYASTRHELLHLYPLLVQGGMLIIDDYGDWQGARRAVDEFVAGLPGRPYLHRIDDTGRLLVKDAGPPTPG